MPLIERLRGQGKVDVVIACDRTEKRRDSIRSQFGIPRFTTDVRAVIEAEDVDLVLILTSMHVHGPLACAALEAGKHVMVEKPMAVTLDEAARMVALARSSPGYLLCAPHVILSPTFQMIWRRLHRGDIGRVRLARGRYGWSGPYWNAWFYQDGGGALFDLAFYNLTSLTALFGPANRVQAMVGVAIPTRIINGQSIEVQADATAQVIIQFACGVLAVVTTGFTMQQYRSPALELYGAGGVMHMLGDDWAPQGYELWQDVFGAWQVYKETDPNWPWTDGLRYLVECILTRTTPLITPEHAYHVLEIAVKAKRAGKTGEAQRIESVFTPVNFDAHGAAEGAPAHLLHNTRR